MGEREVKGGGGCVQKTDRQRQRHTNRDTDRQTEAENETDGQIDRREQRLYRQRQSRGNLLEKSKTHDSWELGE